MKTLVASLLCLTALMPALASAQIYESTDDEGNTVFTDVPSGSAEKVELQAPNIADAPPEAPATSEGDAAAVPALTNGDDGDEDDEPTIVTIPNSHNEEMADEVLDGKRRTVRNADEREEFSDADPRREIMDAEPRRDVLEADERREVRDAQPRREVN